MKNPIAYIKECFCKVNFLNKEIDRISEEIHRCKQRLDEIKIEKDSSSFKWYEIKDKSDFNDEIKSEKKKLKAKIEKYEKEIKELKKQREKASNIRSTAVLIVCGIALFVILIIAITIGSITEKENNISEIESGTTPVIISNTTTESTVIETTEKEITELEASIDAVNLVTGEKCDYCYFAGAYSNDIVLQPVIENEKIAKVEVLEYNDSKTYINIVGLSEGKTTVSLKSEDGTVITSDISIVVEEAETTTEFVTETTTSRAEKIVYSSKTGSHYHKGSCRYANGSELTIEQAERKGLEPCGVCNP